MKIAITMTAMLLVAVASRPVEHRDDMGLPELHKIRRVALSPSYSCRSKETAPSGYQETALFLSKYAEHQNSPDLLFDGACGSQNYFEGSTAGDDMSVIADLGRISLEGVSAHLAFNTANVHSFELYSKFALEARVQTGHTYALLINKHDRRGLLVFAVTRYVPNQSVELRYAVKEYQLLNRGAESEGFGWEVKNQTDFESNRLMDCEPQEACE